MLRPITDFLADRFGKKEDSQDSLPQGLSSELPESVYQKIMAEITFILSKYHPCTVSSGRAEAFLRACRKIIVSHGIHPLTYKLKCIERGQHLAALRTAALAKENKPI